jgi:hypothetical protein
MTDTSNLGLDLNTLLAQPNTEPAALTPEQLETTLEADGVTCMVTAVTIVMSGETPAVMFSLMGVDGKQFTAVPSNTTAYLWPLAQEFVQRKARIVESDQAPGTAAYFVLSEEKASFQ